MHAYPLRLPPARGTWTLGNLAANLTARRVEQYVNAVMERDPPDWVREFTAQELTEAGPFGRAFVDAMLGCCCGGDSGLTVVKGDIDRAFITIALRADAERRKARKRLNRTTTKLKARH